MQFFDAPTTRAALPFEHLIAQLQTLFAAGCEVPARHVHEIAGAATDASALPSPHTSPLTSLLMPAWLPGRYYGVKIVNIASGNAARGLPALHASYLLHDAVTGVPLALLDGDEITARRTAAASALAASMLARQDARHLLVVGAGRVARLLPEAYLAVRSIERVSVWARSLDQADAFVAELQMRGIAADIAPDLPTAASNADIVSCATLASTPLIDGRWLRPGCHLDLIGSFTPAMREADDACFAGAAIYVDTAEALQKSGDLLGPLARGVFKASDVRGTLTTLARAAARGQACGRRHTTERTVFKSVGSALEDLAAAMLVWEGLHPSR